MKALAFLAILIFLIALTSCSRQSVTYYSYNSDTITKVVGDFGTHNFIMGRLIEMI